MPPNANWGSKTPHITAPSAQPMHKIKAISAWGGKGKWNDLVFKNFVNKPDMNKGVKHTILGSNKYDADFTPPTFIYNSKFINVEAGSEALLMEPKPAWANVKDCGSFPCTAPLNVLYQFFDT